MNKYSVLMSVYAKERPENFLISINSMLNQTIKPDEIVVVRDGPLTQDLDKILYKLQKENEELFTVITLKENGGLGRALNYGLKACRNELVARMDTDDISLPERCELQLRQFERNGRLCICGTQINEFLEKPDNILFSRQVPLSCEDIKKFAKRRSPFNHPTVMYKRSKVIASGGYSEYGRKEDLDLFIRMLNQGVYAVNTEEVLLLYRTDQNNFQRRRSWKNCGEYIEIMYRFFKKGYIGLTDLGYVLLGQAAICLLPQNMVKRLTNTFLRKIAE